MITLLRRLFIKNYQNVEDENVRKNHGMLAAIFGIISNLILVCVKVAAAIIISYNAGWSFFPIALIADAINNTSDAFTSIVTLVSFKIAAKPGDKEHPFGHERVEYIADSTCRRSAPECSAGHPPTEQMSNQSRHAASPA